MKPGPKSSRSDIEAIASEGSDMDVEDPDLTSHKYCIKCQLWKHHAAYSLNASRKDGLHTYCKLCSSLHWKAWAEKKRATETPAAEPATEPVTEPATESTDPTPVKEDMLYVMTNSRLPGMVKIGRSASPTRRAAQLASSHPFYIQVPFQYEGMGCLELKAHERLAKHRVDECGGREWFWMEPWQADFIIRALIVEYELDVMRS